MATQTHRRFEKFENPQITAEGKNRASVQLDHLETLWFNTGTRCNLKCTNCYIESSPKNDRLSFITLNTVHSFLKEIKECHLDTKEIGLTGGEPFLNPEIIQIIESCLARGFQTLVLTNAHRVLRKHKESLLELNQKYGSLLTIRVSLDHYTEKIHDVERGKGSFQGALKGIHWLADNHFNYAIAGRRLKEDDPFQCKNHYIEFLKKEGLDLDFSLQKNLVVFAEMNAKKETPEITTACWKILNKSPNAIMCSSSRMVVQRKGESTPKVLACTLLAYDPQFEQGTSLSNSRKKVFLNHPFCSQFCVLGESSCSS